VTPPKGGSRSYDAYAEHRCVCKHLVYADDVLGENCRWCDCTDHRPRGAK